MLLTEVTGDCQPFSDQMMSELDKMSQEDALAYVDRMIKRCVQVRNYYESLPVEPRHLHAWVIECNNIMRFKRLHSQIASEV